MVVSTKTKSNVDSKGAKVPKHTYLRKSAKGWIYYITFNHKGEKYVFNTGILESDRGSRERVTKLVEVERSRARGGSAARPLVSPTCLAAVCLAEIRRREDETPGSPDISHVKRRLRRITDFFGETRDVRTIEIKDAVAFVEARRKETTRLGNTPKYGTIFQALYDLRRAVRLANENGVLDPPFVLHLPRQKKDGDKVAALCAKHRPHAECMAFIFHPTLPKWLSEMCQVVYGSGLRHTEVMSLRPSWVRKEVANGAVRYFIVLPKVLYRPDSSDDIDFPSEISKEIYDLLQRLSEPKRKHDLPIFGKRNPSIAMAKTSRAMGLKMTLTLRDLRASYGRRVYDHFNKNMEMSRIALRHTDHETSRIYIAVADYDSHGISNFTQSFALDTTSVPKKNLVPNS